MSESQKDRESESQHSYYKLLMEMARIDLAIFFKDSIKNADSLTLCPSDSLKLQIIKLIDRINMRSRLHLKYGFDDSVFNTINPAM